MEEILKEILMQLKIRNIIELEKEGLTVQDGSMETKFKSTRRDWVIRDWINTFKDVEGDNSEVANFLTAYVDACDSLEKED